MLDIKVTKTTAPKAKPDEKHLGFGNHYTDHMFIMDYTEGRGWHSPRIEPYHSLELDPAALVFHYAQECFEGMKAYRAANGRVLLFRPEKNAARMQSTHRRLCIPEIPVEDFVQAVKALVSVDKDWVPGEPDTSLYLRPFTIATEAHLGVKPSASYQFIIIASPSGAYYAEGMNPVKIYVEDEYVRATPGGTGYIKCGGNYAASLIGQMKAHDLGLQPGAVAGRCGAQVCGGSGQHELLLQNRRRHPHRALRGHGAAGHHAHELHRAAGKMGL